MSNRWAFMEKFEVPHFDNPNVNYLTRWRIIQTPWFSIFLHKFATPDSRFTLHDHPWSFVSFVLRGGYSQEVVRNWRDTDNPRLEEVRRFSRLRRGDAHFIYRLLRTPTWTLVFTGPRRQSWGYLEAVSTHGWEWTRFDFHPHAREFELARARRALGKEHT